MVGIRGLMAAVAISSAVISLSAGGQVGSSVSLTHTVSVSVPPRLKVQVANLAFASQSPSSVSSVQAKTDGLSITVNATQAWVLSIGSRDSATSKSRVQWSTEGRSGFSTVTPREVAVASGVSYDAKASNVYFRSTPDAKLGGREAEVVVLTVSAP